MILQISLKQVTIHCSTRKFTLGSYYLDRHYNHQNNCEHRACSSPKTKTTIHSYPIRLSLSFFIFSPKKHSYEESKIQNSTDLGQYSAFRCGCFYPEVTEYYERSWENKNRNPTYDSFIPYRSCWASI